MRISALYTRKSTTSKQRNSLAVQLENMHAYCEGHFEVVRTFSDQKTGRTLDRTGLQNAFAWLSKDKTRVLVFYKVDRYARTLDEFQTIRNFIDNDQIRFMDIQQPQDRSDMLIIQLRLMIGENEARLIGNRISSTIRHLQKHGRTWGGDADHMADMRSRSAEVRMSNADARNLKLVRIVNILNRGGAMTQKQIVANLNEIGFTTSRGKAWDQPTLSRTIDRAKRRGLI